MLLFLLATPLSIACAQSSPAAPAPEKPDQLRTLSRDELDVIKIITQQERAWNQGDFDAFARGFDDSPNTLFLAEHISHGFAEMLAGYKKNYPTREAMGQLTYSDLEPRIIDPHVAVVVGKYHLERSKKEGGSADGIFSDVFEKTDKGWKIVVNHTT